jgi:sarcosine oxidase
MAARGVPHEVLDVDDVAARWPHFALPDATIGLYQERGSIVPAARGTRAMQQQARRFGATLVDHAPVDRIEPVPGGVVIRGAQRSVRARRVILCCDAWTNQALNGLDITLPLAVTLEQVTYFQPADPARFQPGRMPLWIWMDDPAYYGFPCYGEPTLKAARDCSGIEVSADNRSFTPAAARLEELADFMATTLPGSGPAIRSKTCLYTLTPDRDFVLDTVPGIDSALVGLGAGHGFKFAPTFGRLLGELASTGTCSADVTPFALDRAALTGPDPSRHWLV